MTPMQLLGPVGELSVERTGGAVPVWVSFLTLLGAVLAFSLIYAWRHSRAAERRPDHTARNRRVQRKAEAIVMPLLIEKLDTLSEHTPARSGQGRSREHPATASPGPPRRPTSGEEDESAGGES